MRHLDDLLYQQLLGKGDSVSAELREHLRSDCEVCAAYLAARTHADAFDGRVDSALLPRRAGPVAAGELEHVLARLERRPSVRLIGLAVAAMALAVVGVGTRMMGRARAPLDDSGIKGDAPITVSTSLAIVGADGRVRAGSPGERVAATDAVSLRLDLSREARISVVRMDAQGAEVVLSNEATPAGNRDLRRAGQLVGIPMAGLTGEQRVQVVASERDLSPTEIEALARGTAVAGAVVGGVSVRVSP